MLNNKITISPKVSKSSNKIYNTTIEIGTMFVWESDYPSNAVLMKISKDKYISLSTGIVFDLTGAVSIKIITDDVLISPSSDC